MLAQVVTLKELDSYWSLMDLMDAHEALDARDEAEAKAMEEAKRKGVEDQ